ncbi:MAG: fumarylacetoacetate hydrolase family protein [Devosia sp.]
MPDFVIAPPAIPSVPVAGGGDFPVRRIYCIGRNYPEHAREMGHDPEREPPFFFSKPADALVTGGAETPYPPATSDLHHEIELVVAIGGEGAGIAVADALDHVFGYAAGIDLTRRDMQAVAKKQARPWDMAKAFDHSAPVGDIVPAARIGHPAKGPIALAVNGKDRQLGDIVDMIWPVPDAIAYLSTLVTLMPGDLIFTGTPAGVAAVERGDLLQGTIAGVGTVTTRIV